MSTVSAMNIQDTLLSATRPDLAAKAATQAKDFEQLFLSQMMNHMFSGMETDSLMGDPETDEVYRAWMVDEYSKIMTDAGGIGIAAHVQKELLSLQEV